MVVITKNPAKVLVRNLAVLNAMKYLNKVKPAKYKLSINPAFVALTEVCFEITSLHPLGRSDVITRIKPVHMLFWSQLS